MPSAIKQSKREIVVLAVARNLTGKGTPAALAAEHLPMIALTRFPWQSFMTKDVAGKHMAALPALEATMRYDMLT